MTRIIAGQFRGRRLTVPAKGTRPTSDRVREALFSRLESQGAVAGARVLDLYAGSGALGLEAISRGAAHATLVDSGRAAITAIRRNIAELAVGPSAAAVQEDAARWTAQLRSVEEQHPWAVEEPHPWSVEEPQSGVSKPPPDASWSVEEPHPWSVEEPRSGVSKPPSESWSVEEPRSGVSKPPRPNPESAFDLVFLDPPYDLPPAELERVLTNLAAPNVLAPDATVVVEQATRNPEPTWPTGLVETSSKAYGETKLYFLEL